MQNDDYLMVIRNNTLFMKLFKLIYVSEHDKYLSDLNSPKCTGNYFQLSSY